jgi:hypothetical protein
VDFLETRGLGATEAKGGWEEDEGLRSTEVEGEWEEDEWLGVVTESREEEEMSTEILLESVGERTGYTKKVSLVWSEQWGEIKGKQPSELGFKSLATEGKICSWNITCLEMNIDLVWRLYNL